MEQVYLYPPILVCNFKSRPYEIKKEFSKNFEEKKSYLKTDYLPASLKIDRAEPTYVDHLLDLYMIRVAAWSVVESGQPDCST